MSDEDLEVRRFGELTVRIHRTQCISSGNCRVVAPEVFVFDADEIITFAESTGEVDRDRLEEACRVCPVDALIVEDKGRQER